MGKDLTLENQKSGNNNTEFAVGDDLTVETRETIGSLIAKHRQEQKDENKIQTTISIETGAGDDKHENEANEAGNAVVKDISGGNLNADGTKTVNQKLEGLQDTLGRWIEPAPRGTIDNTKPSGAVLRDIEKVSSEVFTDGDVCVDPELITPTQETLRVANIVNSRSELLSSNNRFSPKSDALFKGSHTGEQFDNKQILVRQAELGVYDPKSTDTRSWSDLKNVGTWLLLRASGIDINDPRDIRPDEFGDLLAGVYGASAGIVKINPEELRPGAAFQTFPDGKGSIKGKIVGASDEFNAALHGVNSVMNNPLLPFGGFMPVGTIALSVGLSIAVAATLKLIFFGFGFDLVNNSVSYLRGEDSSDVPGYHGLKKDELFQGILSVSDIGLRDTNANFGVAVDRGIDVFFGFPTPPDIRGLASGTANKITASSVKDNALQFADALTRLTRNPGYYAMISRAFMKGWNQLAAAFDNLGSMSGTEVTNGIFNIADVLKGSPIIAMLNVLAGIGDISLGLENGQARAGDGIISIIDNVDRYLKLKPENRIAKHRLNGQRENNLIQDREPVISTGLLPSLFILPQNTANALNMLNRDSTVLLNKQETMANLRKQIVPVAQGRIPREKVQEAEDKLSSEYMPFYFHDLRTNEILAFHAFLSGISDSYAVKYDEQTAYGRADPVMSYANTRRSISIDFIVAAMSETDFSEMWVKINKLVTMIYPQYSKGRVVQSRAANQRFIQPFSQIPTSSPVIRLRLGDLFTTNYSKFALARLFGVGTNNFNAEGTKELTSGPKKEVSSEPVSNRKNPTTNITGKVRDSLGIDLKRPLKKGDRVVYKHNAAGGYSKSILNNNVGIVVSAAVGGVGDALDKLSDPSQILKASVKVKFDAGFETDVPAQNLQRIGEEPKASVQNGAQSQAEASIAAGKFLEKKENAIVRAFDSTAGKGLAGVITALNFDWLDNVPWEVNETLGKAPQMCKISISFQPIHDIGPGLDADGFDRAPVYTVGTIMKDLVGE